MSAEFDRAFLELIRSKKYEDVIAALASAIQRGFGHGWMASLLQAHGFRACDLCYLRRIDKVGERCEHCVRAVALRRASCQHGTSKYDSCNLCGLPFVYCPVCSGRPTATEGVFHAPPACS